MKNIINLSEFKRESYSSLSYKIILNQIIAKKDFSEFNIQNLYFSKCIFNSVNLEASYCNNLFFNNCVFYNVDFNESKLITFTFNNCQFIETYFTEANLYNFNFINCKLSRVLFDGSGLSNIKFYNSQLQDISFLSSLLCRVKIKNSTLKDIEYEYSITYKKFYINDVLTQKGTEFKNYDDFLKEVSLYNLSDFIGITFYIELLSLILRVQILCK